MAVEKAITFDDLANEGTDSEKREGFRRGGQGRSRRGGARGGRRGGTTRGGRRGGRSARGASARGARSRARSRARSKARSRSRMSQRTATKSAAATRAATKKAQATSGPPRGARFKTTKQTRAQAKAVRDRVADINRDFNERTAFKTSTGDFLRDSKGNIVRSSRQVDRFKEDKRKQDIARKLGIDTTLGAAAANPNLRSQEMTPGQFRLSGRLADFQKSLGRGEQTPENLSRLADINRQLGVNPYSGMGILNQLKTQSSDFMKEAPGLARVAGLVANPGLAIATGGKGILGLLGGLKEGVGTALGFGESPQQVVSNPNLRAGTMATQQPGFLSGIASALRLGEGPAFQEERGGGRGEEPLLPIIPPVQPMPAVMPRDPNQIKKAVTPVGTAVAEDAMNEYLKLAGLA